MNLCFNTLISKLLENKIKDKDLFEPYQNESEFKWKTRIVNKLISIK